MVETKTILFDKELKINKLLIVHKYVVTIIKTQEVQENGIKKIKIL